MFADGSASAAARAFGGACFSDGGVAFFEQPSKPNRAAMASARHIVDSFICLLASFDLSRLDLAPAAARAPGRWVRVRKLCAALKSLRLPAPIREVHGRRVKGGNVGSRALLSGGVAWPSGRG